MKKVAAAVYLIAIHCLLVAFILRSDIAVRLGFSEPPTHPHIVTARAINKWVDATTPAGAAIFLGDSITERLSTAAVTPNSVNFGVSWQRTDQLLESIPDSVSRASRIYLLIGTNDFTQHRAAGIEERLTAISAALPDRPLVWTGIMLPEATAANRVIQRLCAARRQCTYVPPRSGADDFVDGVHLTVAGYQRWVADLQEAY